MATCGLTATFAEHGYLPRLGRVCCDRYTDRAGGVGEGHRALAHAFGALSCVVPVVKPRLLTLEFMRADPLAHPGGRAAHP